LSLHPVETVPQKKGGNLKDRNKGREPHPHRTPPPNFNPTFKKRGSSTLKKGNWGEKARGPPPDFSQSIWRTSGKIEALQGGSC